MSFFGCEILLLRVALQYTGQNFQKNSFGKIGMVSKFSLLLQYRVKANHNCDERTRQGKHTEGLRPPHSEFHRLLHAGHNDVFMIEGDHVARIVADFAKADA